MLNQLLDQKMNELRDSIIKEGNIPMITQGDDIADDYLSRRTYASVGSGLNDEVSLHILETNHFVNLPGNSKMQFN